METLNAARESDLFDLELPLRAVFFPYGFSAEIQTNSRAVLQAAEESWGAFRQKFSLPPVRFCVGVSEDGPSECSAVPVFREHGHLFTLVSDAETFVSGDMRQGFAFARFAPGVVAHPPFMRYHFIEGAVLCLLEARYITSVHAGCVSLENRGVLLCGDSGAGKSSLAFACARAGWTFLADDGSSLVRGSKCPTVVTNPYQIRFRQSAVDLFPELKDERVTVRLNGEFAIEIMTTKLPGITTSTESSVSFIVFLRRQTCGGASLERYSKENARRWLEGVTCWGEPDIRRAHRDSLRNLMAEAEVFELRYSELNSAVDRLVAMVRGGT